MWFGKRLSIGSGIQERGNNGIDNPWLGFCYGSWLPHFYWNKGRLTRNEVVDIGWYWMCFHGHFTIWPKPRKESGHGLWKWQR